MSSRSLLSRMPRPEQFKVFRGQIYQEFVSRGWDVKIPEEKIYINEEPAQVPHIMSLLVNNIIENPKAKEGRYPDQLLSVWSVSGYNSEEPTQKVTELLIGEFGVNGKLYASNPFMRLGILNGNEWVYLSKEVPH